jgi:hypothetical protein
MLYKVIKGKSTFELNPELKAIEEFEPLTDRQMTYVILATDYKTPFRKLSIADRKFRAALESGYKLEKDGKRLDMNGRNVTTGKSAQVEKAVRKYNVLQRDEDYETLLGLSKLISDIRELNITNNKSLTELEKAVKFSKDLPALMKAKKELEGILEMREDEVTDIGSPQQEEEVLAVSNMSILAEINEEEQPE